MDSIAEESMKKSKSESDLTGQNLGTAEPTKDEGFDEFPSTERDRSAAGQASKERKKTLVNSGTSPRSSGLGSLVEGLQ